MSNVIIRELSFVLDGQYNCLEAKLEDHERWQHTEERQIKNLGFDKIENLKNDALRCFEANPEYMVKRVHVMLDGWRLCWASVIHITICKPGTDWTKDMRHSLPRKEDGDKQKQVENMVQSACKLFEIVLPVHESLTARHP